MADLETEDGPTETQPERNESPERTEPAQDRSEDRHPKIQTNEADDEKDSARRKEKEKERKRSISKGSSHSLRAASTVEWESEEREAAHLREQNQKLKQQVKSIKQTIRSLKDGQSRPMSSVDEKTAEELRMQNEEYEADIAKWKERAAAVNDVGLLDQLLDEVAQKKLEIKALELQRRQLGDTRRENSKLLHHSEDQPSRQKVFLDLKDERRRQLKKIDEAQSRKEKLSEQIEWIKKRAEEAMAEVESLGLQKYEVANVKNLQKQDEEQHKVLEKLEGQIAIANSSFDAMRTRTSWATQDQQIILNDLRAEIEKVQTQIQQKEALIMTNGGLTEKPPHFVAPLDAQPPKEPRRQNSTSPKTSPRSKPSANQAKKKEDEEKQQHVPKPPPKAKPAAAPKKKAEDKPAPAPAPTSKKPAPPPKKATSEAERKATPEAAASEKPAEEPKKVQSDSNDRLNDLEDDRYSDDHEPVEPSGGAPAQSTSRPSSKASRSSTSSKSRSKSRSDRRSNRSTPDKIEDEGKRSVSSRGDDDGKPPAAQAGGDPAPEYEDDYDQVEEEKPPANRSTDSREQAKRNGSEEVVEEEVKDETEPTFLTE